MASSSSSSSTLAGSAVPRLTAENLQDLTKNKFVVVPNFLSERLQAALRDDVQALRSKNRFKVARIGQDGTNQLNTDIRVAETCFLGRDKLQDVPSTARETLYETLEQIRKDVASHTGQALDGNLSELLYAFYPAGGYYRRHRDAVPGSASTLRKYSLLLYLNDKSNWSDEDGGQLRMHFDSGGDERPASEEPSYADVDPVAGTLVLFNSDAVPHEVLDTGRERTAVVGWYNRPVRAADVAELSGAPERAGGPSPAARLGLLAVAAALIAVGVLQLVS
jgi:Rps23 Pro-64 3,4-dihydroxylase Tpa1-like proline 4-hydroxylase